MNPETVFWIGVAVGLVVGAVLEVRGARAH